MQSRLPHFRGASEVDMVFEMWMGCLVTGLLVDSQFEVGKWNEILHRQEVKLNRKRKEKTEESFAGSVMAGGKNVDLSRLPKLDVTSGDGVESAPRKKGKQTPACGGEQLGCVVVLFGLAIYTCDWHQILTISRSLQNRNNK